MNTIGNDSNTSKTNPDENNNDGLNQKYDTLLLKASPGKQINQESKGDSFSLFHQSSNANPQGSNSNLESGKKRRNEIEPILDKILI